MTHDNSHTVRSRDPDGRDIRPGVARLFRLATRRQASTRDEANEEVLFHLEQRMQQLMDRGMSATEARAKARAQFGDIDAARDSLVNTSRRMETRLMWNESFASLTQDVRFAVRSLRRTPSFLMIALACLTLGIGANVAIFAVVDAVLLKPLPFGRPTELVRVWKNGVVPAGVFEIVKRESRSYQAFEGVEGARQASMTGVGEPARIMVSQSTAGLFAALGVTPALGRAFESDANEQSSPRTAVISHAFWQSHFGGDASIVGKSVQIDGIARVITGVLPEGFAFPTESVQMWIPTTFVRNSPAYWWSNYFMIVARLKPGVSATEAQAEAAVAFPRARASFPQRMPDEWGKNVEVEPLQQSLVQASRPTMVLLYGAVGLVLLVACVNVAGLYFSRTLMRAREIAVRSALGAGRARITRLLLVESLLIAIVGAVLGLALAWIMLRALVTLLPPDTPRLSEITLGGRVLVMTMLLSLGTASVFGLLPVIRVTRRDFAFTLRSDSRSGASRGSARTAWTLAVAQIALAVTLVASAGLLVKSLWQMQHVALGFATTNVLTAEIPLPAFPNDTARRTPQFYESVLEQTRAIPGASSAAVTSSLPFGDGIQSAAMEVEANPTKPGQAPPLPQLTSVTAGYFDALNIPLVRGRLLTDADRQGTQAVGVVDETAAEKLWPNGDPIGKRIRYVWSQDWITVVGVVGRVKRDSLSSAAEPALYVPSSQSFPRAMRVVMRTSMSASAATVALRAAVARVDASVPVSEVKPFATIVSGSAARQRFATFLLVAFGAAALLLGAVGIYGVVSASVAQRRREIGVRMALGASRQMVLRSVLEQSLTISAAGVAVGLAGALASASLLRGLLFGVGVVDAGVLGAVVVLLALVSVAAALAPAVRASRVDPLIAIRAE
ncbi:MAG: ADOP family duplicated permease [Gemmatimonas sp.]